MLQSQQTHNKYNECGNKTSCKILKKKKKMNFHDYDDDESLATIIFVFSFSFFLFWVSLRDKVKMFWVFARFHHTMEIVVIEKNSASHLMI